MTRLLGAVTGATLATGLLLIIVGLRPPPQRRAALGGPGLPRAILHRLLTWGTPARVKTTADPKPQGWTLWRWPIALVAALVVLLMTWWPVAAILVAVTVIGLPVLLSTGNASARAIAEAEALEEWTRGLGDVLRTGAGLEQAITATVRSCPTLLRPPVTALIGRLDARRPLEQALRLFADDLDDATADLVIATLILSSRRRGPGLARVLAALADSVADEVSQRRKVEAERAKPRTTARAVTLITVAALTVGAVNTTYLRPYGSPTGQLVLAVLAAAYLGALWWMYSLTLTALEPRLLTRSVTEQPSMAGERP